MALETVAGGRAWIYSHHLGRGSAAGMGFSTPVGVIPAKDGVLYVANRGSDTNPNQRISKVTVNHEFITEFGKTGPTYGSTEEPHFAFLTSIAMDKDENIYAADEWKHLISVFDSEGNLLRTWGEVGDGEGQLNGPSGCGIDTDGNLWIVNSLNSRVQKFSPEGQFISGFGSKATKKANSTCPGG